MKYAVIGLDGKQIKVSEGQTFKVNSQSKLQFDVLAYSDDVVSLIGTPFLKDVKVDASIIKTTRDRKIIVSRFKAKSRYRKTRGVKQPISFIKIDSIILAGSEPKAIEKKPIVKAKKPAITVKKVKKTKVKE